MFLSLMMSVMLSVAVRLPGSKVRSLMVKFEGMYEPFGHVRHCCRWVEGWQEAITHYHRGQ
jgi:hypothetical protein